MSRASFLIALTLAASVLLSGPARADGWDLFGPDGSYRGRLREEPDGTLERFGPDGSYRGRYERVPGGWDVFGPDGSYRGRIRSENGHDDLPAVIGGEGMRE